MFRADQVFDYDGREEGLDARYILQERKGGKVGQKYVNMY